MNRASRWVRMMAFAGLLFAGWASRLAGGPLEIDLGAGLGYVRLRALPADGALALANRSAALVVDLRYANADSGAATEFFSGLRKRASNKTPVFILANHATAPDLLRAITAGGRGSGIAVVGIAAPGFAPDVAVRGTADDEQLAYAALDQGTGLAKLLADNPGKVRNDEASLTRGSAAETPAENGDTATPAGKAAPPVDATLQRAVHLHRSLQALRKL